MTVLIELILLTTPDAALADRVTATLRHHPDRAADVLALARRDDRIDVLYTPVLRPPPGVPAHLELAQKRPILEEAWTDDQGHLTLSFVNTPVDRVEVDAIASDVDGEVVVDVQLVRDGHRVVADVDHEGAWRLVDGADTHHALTFAADADYAAITDGDLTIVGRAVATSPEAQAAWTADRDLARLAAAERAPKRPRAIRRALDDLLVD